MFSLKTDRAKLNCNAKVSFENLSCYDLNVGIEYSEAIEQECHITLRYEGANGESLLEVVLRGGLITGISLILFNGVPEFFDASFTSSENVENSILSYQLCMDDKSCEIRVVPNEIDQKRDFGFLIYRDAVVFLTKEEEICSLNQVSDELSIMLNKDGLVTGYVIFSEENATRFLETYLAKG